MKKIFSFLSQSNRFWHLLGGFGVAIITLHAGYAIYSAFVAATCLELKDHLYQRKADWIDWVLTFGGGLLAALVILILKYINL
ncbi:MAG: hypothetical protein K6E86_02140 [Bacteroidales bacterium]|nr:hypothetical protein [Bacteroidales bacterium]